MRIHRGESLSSTIVKELQVRVTDSRERIDNLSLGSRISLKFLVGKARRFGAKQFVGWLVAVLEYRCVDFRTIETIPTSRVTQTSHKCFLNSHFGVNCPAVL